MTDRVVTRILSPTIGTENITCYEQFYTWKDHAELLPRLLVHWYPTKVFNILFYVEHETLFLWVSITVGSRNCRFFKAVVLHDDTTLNLVLMTRTVLLVTKNFALGGTKPRYCAHSWFLTFCALLNIMRHCFFWLKLVLMTRIYWGITCLEQFYTWFGSLNLCVVRRLPGFHSG